MESKKVKKITADEALKKLFMSASFIYPWNEAKRYEKIVRKAMK